MSFSNRRRGVRPRCATAVRAVVFSATFTFTVCNLFAVPTARASAMRPSRGDERPPALHVDARAVGEVEREGRALPLGGRLTVVGLELAPGEAPEILDLERFQVFTDDARVVVHGEDGETALPAPDNAYYRGRLASDLDSRALLTVRAAGGVRGLVQRGDEVWLLANGDDAGRLVARRAEAPDRRVGKSSAGEDAGSGFECANPALPAEPGGAALSGLPFTAAATSVPYTARVAVETDWEFFQIFGNQTAATDYVGDLSAFASTAYDTEILTDLQVSYLSLWSSSADPWAQTGTICGFYEFGRWWNDNRANVGRTIAHFLSGKPTGGGVAWLGVLCQGGFNVNIGGGCPGLTPQTDNYGGGYGFSGNLFGNFNLANPQVVWDLVEVSHEIGHNFNSPHTHCYNGLGGSSQPVDKCYGGEPGCYSGATSLPCATPGAGCGTIMSYCHLKSPGMSNVSLSFGTAFPYGTLPQRVPDRMRSHVESIAAFAPACLARIDPCTEDLDLSNQTINGAQTYDVCGTITAHQSYRVGPAGDVTFHAGERVVLNDGFSVAAGGRLTLDSP